MKTRTILKIHVKSWIGNRLLSPMIEFRPSLIVQQMLEQERAAQQPPAPAKKTAPKKAPAKKKVVKRGK